MYNVFARFGDSESAKIACDQVLESTNGIVRAGTRMVVPPHAVDKHNTATADAISMTVTHSTATDHGSFMHPDDTAMAAAEQEAEYDRRTGYEPPRDADYMLCVQGSKEAVEHAAGLLRSLGACSVDIREAKGDFLSGQPPIL